MRRRIIARKDLIVGLDRAFIEIHVLAEFAVDFGQMPERLFEQPFETGKHRIQCGLIPGEICGNELFKFGLTAVGIAPEPGHLFQSAACARALGFSAHFRQILLEFPYS